MLPDLSENLLEKEDKSKLNDELNDTRIKTKVAAIFLFTNISLHTPHTYLPLNMQQVSFAS